MGGRHGIGISGAGEVVDTTVPGVAGTTGGCGALTGAAAVAAVDTTVPADDAVGVGAAAAVMEENQAEMAGQFS
jgi:hypothetical protein